MFKATANKIRGCKRQKIKSFNTYDILRPINIVSYITGFRVLEFPRGNYWTKLSYFYTMVLYCIYFAGWKSEGHLISNSKVYDLQGAIYQMTTVFNQLAMLVIVLVGCHQSKSLRLSVKRIHDVDLTLRALGSAESFNTIHKHMIGVLTFAFSQLASFLGLHIVVSLFFFSNNNSFTAVLFSIFVRIYGQIVEYILIAEFYVIVSCIGSEFKRANDLLGDINVLPSSSIAMELLHYNKYSTNKSYLDTSAKLFTVLPSSRRLRSHLQMTSHEIIRSRRLLQTIRQVHLELYKVSKRISIMYGTQTSMEMSLCILYTTYFLYCLYYTYQYQAYHGLALTITTFGVCLLCINNMVKIFSVNYICEKSTQQALRTNEIIYTFYGQSTDSEIQEELEIFSLQLMHCRVMYSASGLYAFNCKNICSSVGVIATYVVIMIQVTSSIEEEKL